jgi:hypothetical protein
MEARTRNDDADISLELDEAAIVRRAYEHSQRANGGSHEEDWARARQELLDERQRDA